MACIFVNANRSVGTINPNIYGQFSEHLLINTDFTMGQIARKGL